MSCLYRAARMGAFSVMGISDDNLAYSVLFLGFFVVMLITKAGQRVTAPQITCKRNQAKPLLPLATPFNPLDFLTGRTLRVPEDEEFASVQLNKAQPEIYSMSTRSRRVPVKI